MKWTSFLRVILSRNFKPFLFQGKVKELEFENLKNLGLYIHIPFCENLCSFCPYQKVLYEEELAKNYKDALIKEIKIVGENLKEKKEIESLYFGGGTPALLIDYIREILDTLESYFDIKNGIGIELHPNDIDEDLIKKIKELNINMISLGVQSFDENVLNVLGRKNENIEQRIKLINKYNFDVFDIDLIFAIPTQNEKILKNDIKKAFDLGATQISTYPFIDFTFANNNQKPLKEKDKKYMLNKIVEFCKKNQIKRTSVWTFAKPNTKKYSSITRDNFLGFGVSATTLLKDSFKINTFSIENYIKRVDDFILPTSLTLEFSKRQRAIYYLFWACYSMNISKKDFKYLIDKELESMFYIELKICEILKLIKKVDTGYMLTNKGAYYYHYIEQAYTTQYIDKMWNISRNIAFPNKIKLS